MDGEYKMGIRIQLPSIYCNSNYKLNIKITIKIPLSEHYLRMTSSIYVPVLQFIHNTQHSASTVHKEENKTSAAAEGPSYLVL